MRRLGLLRLGDTPWPQVLRGGTIIAAAILFALQCSIGWELMAPRELRQAAWTSLFVIAAANAFGIRERFHRAPRLAVVSFAVPWLAFASLTICNGLLAHRHLQCEAGVVAAAAAAGSSASAQARMACFADNR
jgi:hypothetical protein